MEFSTMTSIDHDYALWFSPITKKPNEDVTLVVTQELLNEAYIPAKKQKEKIVRRP